MPGDDDLYTEYAASPMDEAELQGYARSLSGRRDPFRGGNPGAWEAMVRRERGDLHEGEMQAYARSLAGSDEPLLPAERMSSEQLQEALREGMPKTGREQAQAEIEMALKKVAVRRVMEEAAKAKEAAGPLPFGDAKGALAVGVGSESPARSIKRSLQEVLWGSRESASSLSEVGQNVGEFQRSLKGLRAAEASEGAFLKLLSGAGKALKFVGPIGAGLTAYSLGTGTAGAAERQLAGEQGTGTTVLDILESLMGEIPRNAEGERDPLQNWRKLFADMATRQGEPMGAK